MAAPRTPGRKNKKRSILPFTDKQKDHAHRRIQLRKYFRTAGYKVTPRKLFWRLLIISNILTVIAYIITQASTWEQGFLLYRVITALVFLLLGTPTAFLLVILGFYVFTDLRISNRKKAIEVVLPEFLQLAAANIRAGMPIDQALWSAVRPRFGVLSKEIEDVAKQTIVGKELSEALWEFSETYDSKLVRRSVSLLVEGLEAGSEIGDLLENLALSIQDIQLRKESMAANVTTYIIFIGFSVLFAAPLLFGVSMQMLRVIHSLAGRVDTSSAGSVAGGMSFDLSTEAVAQGDFFVFCIVSLLATSTISSIIIATIKTGDAKDAIKHIPVYAATSIVLFIVAQWVLGYIFAGLL